MRIFYGLTTALKDSLAANNVTNVVTFGDISDLDLNRQGIFPLAHIVTNQATIQGPTVNIDVSITLADIVDYSDQDTKTEEEVFYGNNNLQDVLDTQLFVGNLITQQALRGSLWDLDYKVTGSTLEPFLDRFENVLAGWVLTMTVEIRNTDISIC